MEQDLQRRLVEKKIGALGAIRKLCERRLHKMAPATAAFGHE